eukprot:TRINITY_DN73109_c0_g1_i1.p1 TRINITY_DN73109_c0_g1~~TRINITY_DN73109_c0_g1_i1.p1  ORF type:complete len:993 (-),score=262.54 TRINITY_DN73109_c0_g1_i1:199-3177(-)
MLHRPGPMPAEPLTGSADYFEDDGIGRRSSCSPARKGYAAQQAQQQQRVAMNAEGRFLAHWDKFLEHRKEVQTKFEEVFEMSAERREAGLRLTKLCQQLEGKVDRAVRQAKESASKGEALEDRVDAQVKALDSCKEAIRRGDRCLAEEFFRKLQEASDKLAGNILTLEEAMAVVVRQTRAQITEMGEHIEAKAKEQHAELKDHADQTMAKLHAQLVAAREDRTKDLAASAASAEALERVQSEQSQNLAALESKLAKLQDSVARLEGRASAAEQAELLRAEQFSERLTEVAEQAASGLARVRSEATAAVASAVEMTRDELREEIREESGSLRGTIRSEVHANREDFRAALASSAEEAQRITAELRSEASQLGEESRANGRELLALLEELQGRLGDARAEAHQMVEDTALRLRNETQVSLEALTNQLFSAQEHTAEAHRQLKAVAANVTSVEETLHGARRGLGEVASAVGKAQATAEEAVSEGSRLQAFVDAGLTELRRDVRSGASHVSTLERLLAECRQEVQGHAENLRSEALKNNMASQKDSAELYRRLEALHQAQDEQTARLREQLKDFSRSLSERISEVEERYQEISQQNDLALISVRHEVARVAGAAQDLAPEVEQACRRIVLEEAQTQVDKWAEALQLHKQASADALAAAMAEPKAEVKALRLVLSEQEAESAARLDRLLREEQRQGRAASSKMKQDLEDLSVSIEEKLAAVSAGAKQIALESRQQVSRQLEPLSERLSEAAASVKAARKAEAMLGSQCERLVRTTEELRAGQDSLSLQTSETASNLSSLRSEIRSIGNRDMSVTWTTSSTSPSRPQQQLSDSEVRYNFGHASASSELPASAATIRSTSLEPASWERSSAEPRPALEDASGIAAPACSAPRSRSQSPSAPKVDRERSLPPSKDCPTAFSRLGELRRRLGSPSPAPGAHMLSASDAGAPWSAGLSATGRSASTAISPPTSPPPALTSRLGRGGRGVRPPNFTSSEPAVP